MTWLRGATTWGGLSGELARLITGEQADGQGNTVAAGDRWLRDGRTITDAYTDSGSVSVYADRPAFTPSDVGLFIAGPNIPAGATITTVVNPTSVAISAPATATGSRVTVQVSTDTDSIRTPDIFNVNSGQMANRAGYWVSPGLATAMASNLVTVATPSMRIVTPYVTPPAGCTRWAVRAHFNSTNATPGVYSGMSTYLYVMNLDTGAMVLNGTGNGSPNAAGLYTISGGCTVNVSDPSGIIPANTMFIRAFSTTYPYGVDWWPMLHRAAGPFTFGTPPPGTPGTDWEISEATTGNGGSPIYLSAPGNLLHGLGIKTAAGLGSNDRYTVGFPMSMGKTRIMNHSTAGGVLSMDVGGSRKDASGSGVARNAGGMRLGYWARPFLTSASVTAASPVEYFVSVTADGFVVVLNGDPGNAGAGRLTTAYYCAYEPADPAGDVFPMVFSGGVTADYSTDVSVASWFNPSTQFPYWPTRRRMDAAAVGSVRDWQTGWMRGEPYCYGAGSGPNLGGATIPADVNAVSNITGDANSPMWLTGLGMDSGGMSSPVGVAPVQQAKPGPDGKWWLYPLTLGEGTWSMSGAQEESRIVRGVLRRFAYIPEGGWVSGDELDGGPDGRWLLLKPDYAGAGMARVRTATSTYQGGVAVREV